MIKVASCTNFNNYKFDSIRVLDDVGFIHFYLSTKSIQEQLGVEVPILGELNNLPMTDIPSLFEILEIEKPELAESLSTSVDYTRKQIKIEGIELEAYWFEHENNFGVPYHNLKPLLKPLPRHVQINVLKSLGFALDETPILSLSNAAQLLRKYKCKPIKLKPVSTKGFG